MSLRCTRQPKASATLTEAKAFGNTEGIGVNSMVTKCRRRQTRRHFSLAATAQGDVDASASERTRATDGPLLPVERWYRIEMSIGGHRLLINFELHSTIVMLRMRGAEGSIQHDLQCSRHPIHRSQCRWNWNPEHQCQRHR